MDYVVVDVIGCGCEKLVPDMEHVLDRDVHVVGEGETEGRNVGIANVV